MNNEDQVYLDLSPSSAGHVKSDHLKETLNNYKALSKWEQVVVIITIINRCLVLHSCSNIVTDGHTHHLSPFTPPYAYF